MVKKKWDQEMKIKNPELRQAINDLIFTEKFLDIKQINQLIYLKKWSLADLILLNKAISTKFRILNKLVERELQSAKEQGDGFRPYYSTNIG